MRTGYYIIKTLTGVIFDFLTASNDSDDKPMILYICKNMQWQSNWFLQSGLGNQGERRKKNELKQV